jgi:flagellar biosynthesis chaperone FliJ
METCVKRFRFALQALLVQRRNVENERRHAVALRLRDLESAQMALTYLDGFFREQVAAVHGAGATIDAGRLREHGTYVEARDRRTTDFEHARGQLLAAGRARKILEKLRDRRREAYAAEQRRFDQCEIEESNYRAAFRRN